MTGSTGREGTTRTPDGRTLAWLEVGDPAGPLVLHNHGGPGSRLEAALLAEAATATGLRLVCLDRPGLGRSTPQSPRTFRGWADDLVTVADALGAERFAVTGWSEGGPWALAAAAYLDPARLRHVASVAGGSYGAFGANWAAADLDKADALGGRLALAFHPGFRLMYDLLGAEAVHFSEAFARQLVDACCPADRAVLADEALLAGFLAESKEAFRQGAEGLVRDATPLYEAWPFDVAAIGRPVHLWQGMDDTLVPPKINQTLAERMPSAVWHPVADAGHFVMVVKGRDILALAADDLRRAS